MRTLVALFPLLALVAGCGETAPEAQSPEPPKVAFEGKPDAKMEGIWKSDKPKMEIHLLAAGEAKVISWTPTPDGEKKIEQSGRWGMKESELQFELNVDSATRIETYQASQKEDSLELKRTRPKATYTFTRS